MDVFNFVIFVEKFLYANNVDPDQMPRSVTSELNLHCLAYVAKRVSGLKRVK